MTNALKSIPQYSSQQRCAIMTGLNVDISTRNQPLIFMVALIVLISCFICAAVSSVCVLSCVCKSHTLYTESLSAIRAVFN